MYRGTCSTFFKDRQERFFFLSIILIHLSRANNIFKNIFVTQVIYFNQSNFSVVPIGIYIRTIKMSVKTNRHIICYNALIIIHNKNSYIPYLNEPVQIILRHPLAIFSKIDPLLIKTN